MLSVFLGTDTKKALVAVNAAAQKLKVAVVRASDASSVEDVRAALAGGGMFSEKRVVVLDRISDNRETWQIVIDALPLLAKQTDMYFMYEEKADAATKKLLQKYADTVEIFDAPKSAKPRPTVFALVDYMRVGDKKKLWVGYQQELAIGNAPEAIHGTLFWGVKQALLAARSVQDVQRSRRLLAELAELPHVSRRKGEELEYALERFILSEV
ncbi:hypothetical protein C4568_04595 [Candidatus Parcubacteria bacterium]|nr:MAG: hypothetical protein C4568_04595 [Candidatus Parcubacteria bacterium]